MQKVHPGHDVLSLFGMGQVRDTTSKPLGKLMASVAGAFLIVMAVSFVLSLATSTTGATASSVSSVLLDEPVAFQPGQMITSQLPKSGYVAAP